jgi:hypothetical protein
MREMRNPTTCMQKCKKTYRVFEIIIQVFLILCYAYLVFSLIYSYILINTLATSTNTNAAQLIISLNPYFNVINDSRILYIVVIATAAFWITHIFLELFSPFTRHLFNHKSKSKFLHIANSITNTSDIKMQFIDTTDDYIIQTLSYANSSDKTKEELKSIPEGKRSTYLTLDLMIEMSKDDHDNYQTALSSHNSNFPKIKERYYIDNLKDFYIVSNSERTCWCCHQALFIILVIMGFGEFYRMFACCCVDNKHITVQKQISGVNSSSGITNRKAENRTSNKKGNGEEEQEMMVLNNNKKLFNQKNGNDPSIYKDEYNSENMYSQNYNKYDQKDGKNNNYVHFDE